MTKCRCGIKAKTPQFIFRIVLDIRLTRWVFDSWNRMRAKDVRYPIERCKITVESASAVAHRLLSWAVCSIAHKETNHFGNRCVDGGTNDRFAESSHWLTYSRHIGGAPPLINDQLDAITWSAIRSTKQTYSDACLAEILPLASHVSNRLLQPTALVRTKRSWFSLPSIHRQKKIFFQQSRLLQGVIARAFLYACIYLSDDSSLNHESRVYEICCWRKCTVQGYILGLVSPNWSFLHELLMHKRANTFASLLCSAYIL